MNRQALSASLPTFALLAAVILWSSSFVGMKIALQTMEPLTIVWLRLVAASLVILPVMRKGVGAVYQQGDWKWLGIVALFQPCLYFTLESFALQHTSATEAGMISATLPVIVALLSGILLREKVTPVMFCGVAVSCIGVVWLTLSGEPSPAGPNPLLGNTLECIAMACGAGYTLALRKLGGRYGAWALTALQCFTGLVWFLPGAVISGFPPVNSTTIVALVAVVYLGIFVSLGAFWFYNYALSHVSASSGAVFINLIPVFTATLGWAVLGEQLNSTQYLAAVVVLFGVAMSQRFFIKAKPVPAEIPAS